MYGFNWLKTLNLIILLLYKYVYKCIHYQFSGAYVPLTNEGNILVNGVLASCYAFTHHDLGHIGMTSIRWFPEIVQWIFGNDDGISTVAGMTRDLSQSVLPFGQLWQE